MAGEKLPEGDDRFKPTPAQMRIIRLKAEGLTYKDIAEELGIAPATVKTQMAHAMDRTGYRSAEALVALALREGWIE